MRQIDEPRTGWFVRAMRILFGQSWGRLSSVRPKLGSCEWCHAYTLTALHEIWTRADHTGRMKRLCGDCAESCAG